MGMREELESAIAKHDAPETTTSAPTVSTAPVDTSTAESAPVTVATPATSTGSASTAPTVPADAAAPATGSASTAPTVPADAAAPGDPAKPAEGVKPGETQAEAPVTKEHRIDRPPASWKKEAKGEWATIPLHVRQEVHKREMEVNRVLQETTQARQQAQEFQQVVSPFMARIQAAGITPTQAVNELLKADYTLATAPRQQRAQYMAKLINDYGIEISDLDSALVALAGGKPQQQSAQPQVDPNQITQLVQQQLQSALAPFYQQRQQEQQAIAQEATTTVEQMSLDPKYPYFDDVRLEMSDLIEAYAKRGVDLSLERAYHIATNTNPQITEQRSRQESVQQSTQQHMQAQRAKTASLSVSGSPASGGAHALAGDGSLRGALEAAFGGSR